MCPKGPWLIFFDVTATQCHLPEYSSQNLFKYNIIIRPLLKGVEKLYLFSILFYLFLAITIISVILAIKKDPKYYWVGALTSYIFSFLGSWSIGIYTLSITFVLLALALAHKMGRIKNNFSSLIVIFIALLIWLLSITFIDDYWLFFPFHFYN